MEDFLHDAKTKDYEDGGFSEVEALTMTIAIDELQASKEDKRKRKNKNKENRT